MIPILWLALLLDPSGTGTTPATPRGNAQGTAARAEESVLVSYDLRAALPRWDSGSWTQTLVVIPADHVDDLEEVNLEELYAELGAFELLDLLQQILGDELRAEGRDVSIEGADLVVLAPLSVQEQVRAVLSALSRALSGTVQVKVDVLSLAEGGAVEPPPASVLTQDEAQKLVTNLVGKGAQQREFQFQLMAGRTGWIEQRESVPFLFDFDVEIAQQTFIYDPKVLETPDGWRLLLRGVPSDGGLALSALLVQSEVLALQEKAVPMRGSVALGPDKAIENMAVMDGPQAIQSPDVRVQGLAFDTFLAEGKALVLGTESELGGKKHRQVIVLRRIGGAASAYGTFPIPHSSHTLIAVDAELFRPPRFSIHFSPHNQSEVGSHPLVSATLDAESSSFLQEWLKYRFSVWRRHGPWVLIVTDPAWDGGAAAEIDRLLKSRRAETRVLGLEVSLEAQGASFLTPVRLSLPVREGTSCGIVVGLTQTAVSDYDVEVAQSASVQDPLVAPIFQGLALELSCSQGEGGALTLETRGLAQLLDQGAKPFDPRYALIGPLDRPAVRSLRFDERASLALTQGQPARLRIGPRSPKGDPLGLALEIAVR